MWHFPATKPMSTYITALVAGEYHAVQRHLRGQARRTSRSATTAASRWSSTSTPRSSSKITEQGFAFFEDAFDYPYPFGKYDQLFVPEYNMGAMENAGCVTLPRRVPPAQPPGPRRSTSSAPR